MLQKNADGESGKEKCAEMSLWSGRFGGGWFRGGLILFSLSLLVAGGRIFIRLNNVESGGMGMALAAAMLFLCGALLFAGGLMFVLFPLLSQRLSSAITGMLLPSAKLEKPALMLSPVQGKITAGRLEEALRDLKTLKELHPENASICRMEADLYAGRLNDPQSAFETLRVYLRGSARTPVEECVPLIMRYTDLCLRGGLYGEARECVERELQRTCYSERERNRLSRRLEVIGRREEE